MTEAETKPGRRVRGYHWFVAWRYLMARPRRWSTALILVALALLLLSTAALIIGYFLLEPVDPKVPMSGSSLRQPLLLGAVGGYAFTELCLAMLVIRRYFSFFTSVSIAGCGLGAMALVIVLSVMSGFETDLRQKILGFNAHLLVTKEHGEFTEYRQVAKVIERDPDVVAQTPFVSSEVVVAANNAYANVIIKGIDPLTASRVTDLERNVKAHKRRHGTPLTDAQRDRIRERTMKSIWPLYDDGGVRDVPPDGGAGGDDAGVGDAGAGPDATDPAPPSIDVDDMGSPPDLSGGVAPVGPVDPVPPDVDVDDMPEPPDLSRGPPDTGGDAGEPPTEPELGEQPSDEVPPLEHRLDLDEEELDEDDEDIELPIPARVAILPGILVGAELVKQIHLYPGEEVRVISPIAGFSPTGGPGPDMRYFRVAGVFYTGMYEYDLKFVYVDLKTLQGFLDLGDQVNGIEIRVSDPDGSGAVKRRLKHALGSGYVVQDWQELNRNLFTALSLERLVMFIVLGIIILVASFSIIGNLIMVVVEKAREIALFKTMGSSNAGVMQVFIAQGFFIGFVGAGVGAAHGLVIAVLAKTFGIPLDPDIYYIDRLPVHVEPASVAAVLLAGIGISVLATLYPAWLAARLRPVEGLRYE
jgi:lipoprotein-releasing system permease protein